MPIEAPKTAPKAPDRDTMLNNRDFLKFLADTADGKANAIDMANTEQIKGWHSAYEKQIPVGKKLIEVWTKNIAADTGVQLSQAQKDSLKDYVAQRAAENPAEVEDLAKKLEKAEKLPVQMKKMREDIEKPLKLAGVDKSQIEGLDVEAKKAELQEKVELLKAAKNEPGRLKRFFLKSADTQSANAATAKQEVMDKYGIPEGKIDDELGKAKTHLSMLNTVGSKFGAWVTEAKTHKTQLDTLQSELFAGVPAFDTINSQVADMVKENLRKLSETASRTDRTAAQNRPDKQKHFDALAKFSTLRTEQARDFIPGLDAGADMAALDAELESEVTTEIANIIRTKDLGSRPLEDMKSALRPFITAEKLGRRTKQQCKELLLKTIQEALDAGLEGENKAARALLINGLIISLR